MHEDRSRAESFGAVAALYDRARPTYPPALIDALLAGGPRRALDVGTGTGIAAAMLAARGVSVLGVEVDERMAALARAKGLAVEVTPFEHWRPAGRSFDLVTAAQAWHWVDPLEGPVRVASVLARGGRIALFWNLGEPPAHVQARFEQIYARIAPALANQAVALGNGDGAVAVSRAGIENSDRFGSVRVRRFRWRETYRAGDWIDLLRTHSDHQALAPRTLEDLLAAVGEAIEALGGSFEMPYETVLVEATRR